MADTVKAQSRGFWPGFSTGLFVPILVGVVIGFSGLGRPWFGIASLVELTAAFLAVVLLPRWRRYAAGALAGWAVLPALGLVWILVTYLFWVPGGVNPKVDHDAFLSALRKDVPAFDDYSDDELNDMADVACGELASIPAVAAIDWRDDVSANDREHLVYLALTQGCPEESSSGRGA